VIAPGLTAEVETLRGTVTADALGITLMHEHVFVLTPEITDNYPDTWVSDQVRIQDAVDRLRQLYEAGVRTIVDLTVVGLGRNIPRVQQVGEQVALNIVVATGLYTYRDLPMHFAQRGPGGLFDSPEYLHELFIRDIQVGIAGTAVKAAVLKCATDEPGVTPGVERVLRAVARAQRETGVPISTHTDAATRRGLDQQRIFREEGVDLGRVVIGHSGDTTDTDYLLELIDNGSYLGMDRFGFDYLLGLEPRIDTVAELCHRGLADRMVLSHDYSCHNDWLDYPALQTGAPDWGFTLIPDQVVPSLKERGVSDEQIHQMLVINPRNVLAGP
jgi:phosphotriesterase-related protein